MPRLKHRPLSKTLHHSSAADQYGGDDEKHSEDSDAHEQKRSYNRQHDIKLRDTTSRVANSKCYATSSMPRQEHEQHSIANSRPKTTHLQHLSERFQTSVPAALNWRPGKHEEDTKPGSVREDERLIQVAIRCRPRKRRRHERRAATASGIRRTNEWLSRRHDASFDSDENELSSSSSSDLGDAGHEGSGGVIEFAPEHLHPHPHSSRHWRSKTMHDASSREKKTPSLYIQTHSQGTTKRRFEFDYIFPPWKKQQEVYEASVQDQVAHVLHAHQQCCPSTHATIVAYGQTGTGKTYTMGMLSNFRDEVERGIIPRAISQTMDYAEAWNKSRNSHAEPHHVAAPALRSGSENETLVVSMSYLQIYLETIQDLLVFPVDGLNASSSNGQRKHPDLQVRQKQSQAFYVEGLSEYEVSTMEDVQVLLETAARNRILASTARNKTSSRSHTLLTVSLKRARRKATRDMDGYASSSCDSSSSRGDGSESDEDDADEAYTISFVDLAGSERVDGTLHFLRTTRKRQELRIREAKFINRSLSALGSVIAALAQPKARRSSSMLTPAGTIQGRKVSKAAAPLSRPQQHAAPQHIRFRDSQLTKLLQSRLMTGKGRLLLIATIDDQVANLTETLSTLKFASQCRRVELQSPRSKAAAKRKDSLLEQVFDEMKTTYEEREAALHALEHQLQLVKKEKTLQLEQHPTRLASYVALCTLADQAVRPGEVKELHPTLDSFASEDEVAKHIAALCVKLQTAIAAKAHEDGMLCSSESLTQKIADDGGHVKQSSRRQAAASSTTHRSIEKAMERDNALDSRPSSPSAAKKSRRVDSVPATSGGYAPSTMAQAPSICANGLKSARLSAEQEDEFQAIARILLASDTLQAFLVNPDDEIDDSFSQIDH